MILMTIPIHSQKNTVTGANINIYLYLTRCVDNFCNRNYRDEVNRCYQPTVDEKYEEGGE